MMNLKYIFLLVVASLTRYQISQAQHLETAPADDWVLEVDFEQTTKVDKYDIKGGVYFKLIDYQTNFIEESIYSHFVQDVIGISGITEASKIELTYDSSYQFLKLHKVIVWRDGQPIDHTDKLTFEYIKNEQQLQSNIYEGKVTALGILEDLRKNDHVEIAYTLVGINPIFDGEQYQLLPLEDLNPVDKISIRAIYPNNEGYSYQCQGCDKNELKTKQDGENTILTLVRKNTQFVKLENTMTPWVIPYDYLEVSSTQNWQEVIHWADKIFATRETDKIDDALDELFKKNFSTTEKIMQS